MTMLALDRARRCLAGAALAALSVSAASAQGFPPVVIAGIYQQTTNTLSTAAEPGCDLGNAGCYFVFGRVPLGKQLVVTNVSCNVVMVGFFEAFLRPQRPNGEFISRFQYLHASKTDVNLYVLNNTTLAPFGPRERPLVWIKATNPASITGACTIAGQISDVPAP